MGGRGGIQTETIENPIVPLGNNLYETGIISVPADSVIKAGVVLTRAGNKFVPVTDSETQTPLAVNPFEIPNKTQAAADLSIRALISGQVRADLLTIDGDSITGPEMDMLRDYGIIPIKVTDLSRTE